MNNFFVGIIATLTVIVVIFGCSKLAEYERTKEAYKDTHFNVHINCTNCDRRHHPDFEKGKTVQNSTYECWDCGMIGKLNKAQDKSYVYYHIERVK